MKFSTPLVVLALVTATIAIAPAAAQPPDPWIVEGIDLRDLPPATILPGVRVLPYPNGPVGSADELAAQSDTTLPTLPQGDRPATNTPDFMLDTASVLTQRTNRTPGS